MEDHPRSLVVRFRKLSPARRRLVLAAAVLAGVFLLFMLTPSRDVRPPHKAVPVTPNPASLNSEILAPDGLRSMSIDTKEASSPASLSVQSEFYKMRPTDTSNILHEPPIVYSAELSVVTKEFARSRASLEEILERHRGYVAKLRMVGQPSGSALSATLRVPSSEYRSVLADLKGVGLVEHEEEAADEIAQQHSEIEARLVNAQNEEQRLQRILQDRSDKDYDPAALQRQVAVLRGEIERIQTERYAAGSRVSFANVFFALREERIPPAETIGAKLRAAAAGGLSDAFESISAIALFLAGRGPLLALWMVLLYFPARLLWRRRSLLAFREAESPKLP
jgi:hypothetical protein